MKTHKNIYRKICSKENLFLAFQKARKGKGKKDYVIKFESKLEEEIPISLERKLSLKFPHCLFKAPKSI